MPLIVENGTIVAGANTYVDLVGVRAYATARGINLSSDDAVVSAQIINAMDFIESFHNQFVGNRVDDAQPLSWPRSGVVYESGNAFPQDDIPDALIQAECEAVIAIFQGITLQPNVDSSAGGFVIQEKIGPIETRYSESVGTGSQPQLTKVMVKLDSLLRPIAALQVVRI